MASRSLKDFNASRRVFLCLHVMHFNPLISDVKNLLFFYHGFEFIIY